MPAKKTSAKKAPAKKSPVKRPVAKKAPASKARVKTTSKSVAKNAAYEDLWEDDLIAQYPTVRKNNFMSLAALGLGTLFVIIGIYFQLHKEDPQTTIPAEQTGMNATGVSTGTTPITPPASGAGSAAAYGVFPVDAQKMVETFYGYFNDDQFDQIPALYDKNFTNIPNLRQYFNPTRLKNWKLNIIGDLSISEVNAVIDNPISQKNPNAMVVQYNTKYTLKQDGKEYNETWFAYVLKVNGGYKLNGFECQENCAASPFFQLR